MNEIKNIIKILVVLISVNNLQAQCTNIVNIEGSGDYAVTGNYYKDIYHVLDQFEGHYKYINGSTTFEIVLEKMEKSTISSNRYCEDIIIGAYKYVKDGVLVYDKLNDLNNNYSNGNKYIISGNSILTGQYRGCDDCAANEKRVVLSIGEPEAKQYYDLFVRKITHNGQEAIKIFIHLHIASRTNGKVGDPPLPEMKLPFGQELILIKQ